MRNFFNIFKDTSTSCILALCLVLLTGVRPALADLNATTDDRSTAVPTSWWVYTGVTNLQVANAITQNGARLTDIEIHSIVGGSPRFTVRMVKNSGTYAVPGWWWYYGQTFSQISALLTANNARLIDLEPYDAGGGAIRYAAVMVSNTGTAARNWWYMSGVNSTQINDRINLGYRLIDLDTYFVGASKFYSAVFVLNSGTDAKSWQWWLNQTAAGVASKLSAFGGRLVDIDRQPDGTFNVIMVKNSGADAFNWWWMTDFASITDFMNYANQLAARPVDIETYVNALGQRRYFGIFIDNANAATRRIRGEFAKSFLDANGNPTRGIFEAYLKRVGSSATVNLNSSRQAETASSLKSLHLLHAMRSVQAGESLASGFVYYNYPSSTQPNPKDACPNPAEEILANRKTDYNFEKGLDEMMRISDNRTTRGTVLRYGGFAPFNTTAAAVGLTGTQLRHNIGCAYRNLTTGKYDLSLRNNTTAADLAKIYESVWNSTSVTGLGRTEFLESANPSTGVGSALQTIINEEAAAQGKSAIAAQFGSLVKTWGKGGSYGTCLPNSTGGCGQPVMIRSGTGIIQLPVKSLGLTVYRTYVFGRLISDVPTVSFSSPDIATYDATFSKVSNELYREEIRSALLTW